MTLLPSIDNRIFQIAPKYRLLCLSIRCTEIQNFTYAKKLLDEVCTSILENDFQWADSHIKAWAELYRQFDSNPKRTPCSAAALRKQAAKDGSIQSINPIVDIYNAISIKYTVSIGGEDIKAYQGSPTLTIANGSELFDTINHGEPFTETPEAGEVIWRDNAGVTCRRWNWRQCVRTRINSDTRHIWFILESLPEMPLESLQDAGQEMIKHLQVIMPDLVVEQSHLYTKDVIEPDML